MATPVLEFRSVLPIRETITLRRQMAAIEVLPDGNGRSRPGMLLHLPPGTRIEICADGFNERTATVRSNGGRYFVLRDSLLL